MKETIKSLIKGLFSVEMLLYMLFGAGTAAIDFFTEIFLYNNLAFNSHTAVVVTANCISFILSVSFAFITNKKFVFKSKSESAKDFLKEALKFFAARFLSFLFSLVGMVVLVDKLGCSNSLSKISLSVVVVILNYLFSKLLIFTSNDKKDKKAG